MSKATCPLDKFPDVCNFILFLKELGMTHRIQHFAIGFSKDKPDHSATVQTADVTCIRLY